MPAKNANVLFNIAKIEQKNAKRVTMLDNGIKL
jgi:hypothetical protein